MVARSHNNLTDVASLVVGSTEDAAARTRVMVVLPEVRALAAVDALVLSGGSGFGLEAATGLMGWLAARGRGFTG